MQILKWYVCGTIFNDIRREKHSAYMSKGRKVQISFYKISKFSGAVSQKHSYLHDPSRHRNNRMAQPIRCHYQYSTYTQFDYDANDRR